MDFSEFKQKVQNALPPRVILVNPGGGTSTILSYSLNQVSYQRGNSMITVSLKDLFDAYMRFKGSRLTTSDLKGINPSVFDSQAKPAGHSCNCTFLFLVLQQIGLVTDIRGQGVRGSPFYVVLKD